MLRRWLRDEPELFALALIVLFFAISAIEPAMPYFAGEERRFMPLSPDVRITIPDLPPPLNPIELIRL